MQVGLKTINGNQYYFDEQGLQKKGYAGTFNNQFMYFDPTTGVGKSAVEYQFTQGLTAQNDAFTPHNAAKSYDSKSFDNVDGFLTADTWYLPTDILKNGTTWTPTTENDKRPLLMTWWPDKQTQADYLNYMSKSGLTADKVQYTAQSNQNDLNVAAQTVQMMIEQRIAQNTSTQWLKDTMTSFIKEEYNWSSQSENIDYSGLQFQGGFLKYNNSPLTPDTNSAFRLLNRVLFNRDDKSDAKGSEFLLANDVDNSNPIVQAEQLNWLHYLMNFGSITANDLDANFDGIRIDAVDNVDADLLDIAGDYFKAVYGVNQNDNKANQHISILEDWSGLDVGLVNDMGNPQLTMDSRIQNAFLNALTKSPDNRWGINALISNSIVNRENDDSSQSIVPNYSFIRAHDSEVQGILGQILTDHTTAKSGNDFTPEELKQAFDIYYADQNSPIKTYTHYNMVSAYAALLTNKDTIPRPYYGDLYTDGGQYMANKTINYDAITALLKARVKYVSGNQTMSVDAKHGDVLTSVRTGNGETQGIGVIISNNPKLDLGNDKITLSMGKNHANQQYRALMLTTDTGIIVYDSDKSAPLVWTDANGNLTFGNQDIKGYGENNAQVSGYLAVWVPVGASENQNVTVAASTTQSTDGSVFHANAALDSNVIYEGFSNFQDMPETTDQRTNVVISQNADLFKSWGITSFQMAPQYRSSQDHTFVDSVIDNGYAFTDRYDLGFNTPTKYGTVDDLRSALKALHAHGMQAIADWVPDQIYNLPGQQVTSVTRVDQQGVTWPSAVMENVLYVVNTNGGGDYQAKYGGEYLGELQEKYPELFKKNQLSTGVPMDANTKIKEWSAKYFNGTNVLGHGAFYVLKDWASNQYFNISKTDEVFLPLQLMNKTANTGFTIDTKGAKYFSLSGYQAKDTFVQDGNGNWYYFDKNGYMVKPNTSDSGLIKVNSQNFDGTNDANGGKYYYFMPNGVELRNSFVKDINGNTYYFNSMGEMLSDQYVFDNSGNAYHVNQDGTMSTGLTHLGDNLQYFGLNGVQVKDAYIYDKYSNKWYQFEAGSGNGKEINRPSDTESLNYTTIDSSSNIGINTDYTAYITSTIRQDGLYKNTPWGVVTKDQDGNGVKWAYQGDTDQYNGQQVQVIRQYIDSKGVNWSLVTINDQKLWVDNRALTQMPFTVSNQASFIAFTGRNDGMYLNAPYRAKGAKFADRTKQYEGQRVTIAGTANVNGVSWNLVSVNGVQYWVDNRSFATNFTREVNNKIFVNSANRSDGLYINGTYGQSNSRWVGNTKKYNNQIVTVAKQYYDAKGVVWNQVVLGGQTVWVDNRAFTQLQIQNINQQLYINSNKRTDSLYANMPYRADGARWVDRTTSFNGQRVNAIKQGKDAYGVTWNLIKLNDQELWVDKNALTTTFTQNLNTNMYVNSSQRTDGLYITAPYGVKNSKWVGNTKSVNGKYVKITQQFANENGVTFYLTSLNGQNTWVDKRAFSTTFDQIVALNATINMRQSADGMYLNASYGEINSKYAGDVSPYNNQKVTVTKEHSDAKGVVWYLAIVNNQQVWIDKRSFSPVVTKSVAYSATIILRGNSSDGLYLNAPYGATNAKFFDKTSNNKYKNTKVQVMEEYTDSKGVTWNLIKLGGTNGQQVWVDKRALKV
ncbi:glycoside hydrolase family 70 protein [Leuconostoc rapi]